MGARMHRYLRGNVLGLVAIFIALVGTAVAVQKAPKNSVVSKSIKNGQVKNPDLAAGAVTADKVAADSLGAAQIDESTLPDQNSGGTVTSVGSGAGLSGGPITDDGTLSIAPEFQLPQDCPNGQVAKRAGGSWACAADDNSGGTVTSVDAGTGLAGGPITGSGTLSVAPDFRLPQSCAANQVPKRVGGAWTCATDANSGGTVTSVGTSGGLTGGPITGSGTLSIADNAVTAAKLNDNAGFGSQSAAALTSGTAITYLTTPFTAAASGVCMVNASVSIETAGANATGVLQLDVAVQDNAVDLITSADDFDIMGTGETAGSGSRTEFVSILAGHQYRFGTVINATGDFVADLAERRATFLCV